MLLLISIIAFNIIKIRRYETTPPLEINYLTVCEITSNTAFYDNKFVNIRAAIKGYHEIFLYDKNCSGNRNIILVNFDADSRQQLIDLAKEAQLKKSDITGEIFLSGKFEQNKGKLLYYERLLTVDETNVKPVPLTVHRVSDIKIKRFLPCGESYVKPEVQNCN
jgi:hypothetical protein